MNEIVKDIIYLLIVFLIVWISFYLYTRHDTIEKRTSRYNCDLTEFLAHIPNDIKEECRRQKIQAINNQKG